MDKRTRRVVRWIVLGVVAAVVVATAIWRSVQPDATLTVIRPRTETLRAYVAEQAVTELPHDQLISMPIAGWLEPITLREGDRVEANDVVARLDTSDLADRVKQIAQQVAALKTQIEKSKDNRLEEGMLLEVNASVKAVDETVKAGERKVEAAKAVADYARYELGRIQKAIKSGAASELELRRAETAHRKASAEHRSDVSEQAAIKTIAAVGHIWPKFVKDYMDLKSYDRTRCGQQIDEAEASPAAGTAGQAGRRDGRAVAGALPQQQEAERDAWRTAARGQRRRRSRGADHIRRLKPNWNMCDRPNSGRSSGSTSYW
jgi:HlyD family secretion protein